MEKAQIKKINEDFLDSPDNEANLFVEPASSLDAEYNNAEAITIMTSVQYK